MKIMLPHGEYQRLASDFKVARLTVYRALTGKSKTPQAKMLRAAAIQRGGVIFNPSVKFTGDRPDCITTFETADNTMTQRFSDRVHLIANLTTGNVTTYIDGKQVEICEDIEMSQFPVIARQAQLKAKELNR